ncbi:hypothetical protein OHR86_16185 [Streptomyces sp. NBC_00441]|uniref:ParB/RepB/Spo0J family partition protein n=1 Tax=Streptomyces sp. NBC_00441 TaxID=2975742 RepID=UPI002E2E300B|nr:hypothetical protein [Streptomyces sp. NBC_00441]
MSHAAPRETTADDASPNALLARTTAALHAAPVRLVRIDSLTWPDSPRGTGENARHARRLADAESPLPPIVVLRPGLRVVDGVHRVRAARLRGQRSVRARFFDGTEDEAFVFAVHVNTEEGLPLPAADRTSAARRILLTHPQWSDRAVAAISGLSAGTVSRLRRRDAEESEIRRPRVGRDGRTRPLNCAEGRRLAGELLRADPDAPLRRVAAAAGISSATAADVRDRLRRGVDPVPDRDRTGPPGAGRSHLSAVRSTMPEEQRHKSPAELAQILDRLCRDPSLRFSEAGREVLRMLVMCTTVTRDRHRLAEALPEHSLALLVELMDDYASIWRSLDADRGRRGEGLARQTAL